MQEKETRSIDEIIGSGAKFDTLTKDEQALVMDLAYEASKDFVTAIDWMSVGHGATWQAANQEEIEKLMASLTASQELSGISMFGATAGPQVMKELQVFLLMGAYLMAKSLDRLEDC